LRELDLGVAEPTLYGELAEPAPQGFASGETNYTAAKETMDADREPLDDLTVGGAN
jgi:hypothetical protein